MKKKTCFVYSFHDFPVWKFEATKANLSSHCLRFKYVITTVSKYLTEE